MVRQIKCKLLHSAHVSKETNTWLAGQRDGRCSFVFTPKHGSWLNLVEGFFSKIARSEADPKRLSNGYVSLINWLSSRVA